MQKTDRKVRKINAVLQHPTFSFMLANIDQEVVGCPDANAAKPEFANFPMELAALQSDSFLFPAILCCS